MSFFVVANLGDAVLNIPSATVDTGGTVLTGGFIFVDNTTNAPITYTLSAALSPFVLFKDVAGNANTYPITITYSGGIDSGTSTQLALPNQWVWLVWNGAGYWSIG